MNFGSLFSRFNVIAGYVAQAVAAAASKSLSFPVGNYVVSAKDVSGAPQHLSIGAAIFAAEQVFFGMIGTLQVGDLMVTIAPRSSLVSSS